MSRFSQRIGAVETPSIVQLEGMSDALRNSVWNYIVALFSEGESGWWAIAEQSAQFFFKVPVDDLPPYNLKRRDWIRTRLYEMPWYEVYDYVEFVARWHDHGREGTTMRRDRIHAIFNHIFEEELSGYRFVAGELVPISSPAEVAAVESAMSATANAGLSGAHAHIATALQLLGKRPDPDYRNSIKESISAVEALAKQLGTSNSQGLADALTELGKKIPIHRGLRAGLLSLYGYTSDEGGIRHAMLDEPSLGYDEAKYMAVACSAFINFLAAKAQTAGLLVRI